MDSYEGEERKPLLCNKLPASEDPLPATIRETTLIVERRFQDTPISLKCPTCRQEVITLLRYEYGTRTLMATLFLFLAGPVCWLGCCLLPFCVNKLRDVIHTCPSCNCVIGKYIRN